MSTNDLFVSYVIQKAKIILNEEGTEASAASGVVMDDSSAIVSNKFIFNLHQPFLYYLVDTDSGLIMFNGKVMVPNEAEGELEVYIMDYGASNSIMYSIFIIFLIVFIL